MEWQGVSQRSYWRRAVQRLVRFPASMGVLLGGAIWLPFGLTGTLGVAALVYFVVSGMIVTVLVGAVWRYRRLRDRKSAEARPRPGLPPMREPPVRAPVPVPGSGGMREQDERHEPSKS